MNEYKITELWLYNLVCCIILYFLIYFFLILKNNLLKFNLGCCIIFLTFMFMLNMYETLKYYYKSGEQKEK